MVMRDIFIVKAFFPQILFKDKKITVSWELMQITKFFKVQLKIESV